MGVYQWLGRGFFSGSLFILKKPPPENRRRIRKNSKKGDKKL